MTTFTNSAFYYGHVVTSANNSVDFDEGSGNIIATLRIGTYTLEEFAAEVVRAMNAVGDETYNYAIDRGERLITITGTDNFQLLPVTGTTSSISALPLAGFTIDTSLATSHESNTASGSAYYPQFKLQQYVSFDDIEEASGGSVNESASGEVEIVSFGRINYMECNITFITSKPLGRSSPVIENLNGVSDARDFMKAITRKQRIEFMEDIDNPSVFTKCILESTPESSDGISFKLKELYGAKFIGFFETGKLKFRKVV